MACTPIHCLPPGAVSVRFALIAGRAGGAVPPWPARCPGIAASGALHKAPGPGKRAGCRLSPAGPVTGCTLRCYGRVAKQLVGHVFDQHACSHAMRTRQHNLFADAAYLTETTPDDLPDRDGAR